MWLRARTAGNEASAAPIASSATWRRARSPLGDEVYKLGGETVGRQLRGLLVHHLLELLERSPPRVVGELQNGQLDLPKEKSRRLQCCKQRPFHEDVCNASVLHMAEMKWTSEPSRGQRASLWPACQLTMVMPRLHMSDLTL